MAAFDSLAASYDVRWTETTAGMAQRQSVWRHVDPLVRRGDRALDLGCGTGEDALHLAGLGAAVTAVDASPEMVRLARGKGVDAYVMWAEDIGNTDDVYDLILSNFGVLNCIGDLCGLREQLASAVRPGGYLAICLMGRFCLWETAYYLVRGKWRKAARRWFGSATALAGLCVYYPTVRKVRQALAPVFELYKDAGIGLCVPPSFVPALPGRLVSAWSRIDQRHENGTARFLADHRLLVFRRK